MTREKQIEYFKGCLMATGREGIEDLLDFIEELGFYDAPASGGNHCCKDGGLLEHTVNVMQYAEKIGLTLLGSEAYNKIHSSVIIASALHDLGKCGRYGSPYYVENMVQDGRPTKKNPEQKYKRSESKPYKISSDLCHIDHPLRSVELAARYIDLTEEEEHAIFYHDGAYGSLAYDLKGHEEPLQVIIHFADFWSAQFLEVGKLDRFNDQVKSEETTDEVKEEGENNSSLHGLDRYFPLSKMSIQLNNLSSSKFTLGTVIDKRLTTRLQEISNTASKAVETIPVPSAIVKQAVDQATALITAATHGHVR